MKDTKSNQEATARPWYLGQCEGLIFANNKPNEPEAIVECVGKRADANAALIVRAVNEYDALNQVAEAAKKYCSGWVTPSAIVEALNALAAIRKQ